MKIKGVDFPEALLNALRKDQLVVFAGAGVSMGLPAKLPSFRELATHVAKGTGESIANYETETQFLGRLRDRGVKVHQLAAGILQPNNLKPNEIHSNLLRLFQETGPVRIVTTNFDRLFENAAETGDLFKTKPKIFEAPALPLGSRFEGIVHLHGSVNEPEEMVLTQRDFGRTYLTEADGWARRFLVDLFSTYTVVFVGYRHRDTIMTYLTPSLPPDGKERRFALVSKKDDFNHWHTMGIEPIIFPQEEDYTSLDIAFKGLADFSRRGVLGWQQEIARIASEEPPKIDDEDSHTIDYALKSVELTKFFVKAARSPEWIDWLNSRKHLKPLFAEEKLKDQDRLLSEWLADYCAIANLDPDLLFSLISSHHGRLNWYFWAMLVQKLSSSKEKALNPKILSQWVHILVGCIPMNTDRHHEYRLLILAKYCVRAEELNSLLQVYDTMAAKLIWFLPRFYQSRNNPWKYPMKKLWRKCLEPNLHRIAYTLLELTTMRLEQRHSAIITWNQSNDETDSDSYARSAIETHEQDKYSYCWISPLINIVRDCLEWLAINEPAKTDAWCNRFSSANAPLLQRLAIHATNTREDLSAQDKMTWLLERYDVNNDAIYHEVFRITASTYPQTNCQQRKMLIQAISQYQISADIFNDDVEKLAHQMYHQFNWFQWLHIADPNCSLVKAELDKILVQYPKFRPREHLDFLTWTEKGQLTGPWAVKELLAKPPSEWLSDLLNYQPNEQELKAPRRTMLCVVCEASEKDMVWGLDLANTLAARSMWSCDLWDCVITAWEKGKLDSDTMERVLSHLSTNQLYQYNSKSIADVLGRLAKEINKGDVGRYLSELNSIAIALYPYAAAAEFHEFAKTSWLTNAINNPCGKLAVFWIDSIIIWYKQHSVPPQAFNAEYQCALKTIMGEKDIPGKLGRTILASHFHVLYYVDSAWAEEHLLPLFDAQHEDFQCAWDGYLACGQLSLPIAELLKDKFIGGLQRVVQSFLPEKLERFIGFYVLAMSRLIDNANDKWISEFFKHTRNNTKAKHTFALGIGRLLCDLDESNQKEWWNAWLKDYWNNRLQGVPCPLEDVETAEMFAWVVHLQGIFPHAVAMAVGMKSVILEDHSDLLLRQISESSLIDRYPNDLAKLLIHLGKSDRLPWFWKEDINVFHQLLEKDLSDELTQGLREIILRIQVF